MAWLYDHWPGKRRQLAVIQAGQFVVRRTRLESDVLLSYRSNVMKPGKLKRDSQCSRRRIVATTAAIPLKSRVTTTVFEKA